MYLNHLIKITTSSTTMDDSDKTIKIQRLKGASNYRIWSAEISAHLEGKGLMGVTLGEEPKPDELNTPHWNTQAVGTTEGSSFGCGKRVN
jgi:hypothetical protein